MILKRQAVLGDPHVHSHLVTVPSPCGLLSSDSCLQPNTLKLCGTSGNVFFKIHLRRMNPQQLVLERQEVLQRHNASVTLNTGRPAARADELQRNSHNFATATPRFARKVSAWNPPSHAEGARPQNFHGLNNRGIRFRKCISVNSLTLRHFSFGTRVFFYRGMFLFDLSHARCVVDQRSGDGRISGRS